MFRLKLRNIYDVLCMKSFISDHVLSDNYINIRVQFKKKNKTDGS